MPYYRNRWLHSQNAASLKFPRVEREAEPSATRQTSHDALNTFSFFFFLFTPSPLSLSINLTPCIYITPLHVINFVFSLSLSLLFSSLSLCLQVSFHSGAAGSGSATTPQRSSPSLLMITQLFLVSLSLSTLSTLPLSPHYSLLSHDGQLMFTVNMIAVLSITL